MTAKIVSIVGATGAQGGSVVDAVLADKSYSVRALTRNPSSESAKALTARGINVVKADLNDFESLKSAFEGSYAIYAVTDFFEPFGKYGPQKAIEIESQQGFNVAKAAVATTGLQHFIWSTLPNGSKISGGKYVVPHFASKNLVDDFIRSQPELLSKTTFLWVTFYAQNYGFPMFTPINVPSAGKYIQLGVTSPNVPIMAIGDARENVGKFVKAALDQPDKTIGGKIVLASTEEVTAGEMLQMWAKVQGKKAEYVQVDNQAYNAIWPLWAEEMGVMMRFWEEVRERSWVDDAEILTREDLRINGLIGLEQAFSKLQF